MKKLKTIKLVAESGQFTEKTFGLIFIDNITNETLLYEFDDIPLEPKLKTRIKEWYQSYYKYTGMSIVQLNKQLEKINELDEIGVEITKSIAQAFSNKIDCNVIYYSRGKDKFIFETFTQIS